METVFGTSEDPITFADADLVDAAPVTAITVKEGDTVITDITLYWDETRVLTVTADALVSITEIEVLDDGSDPTTDVTFVESATPGSYTLSGSIPGDYTIEISMANPYNAAPATNSFNVTVEERTMILGTVEMKLKGGASEDENGFLKIEIPANSNDFRSTAEFVPSPNNFTVTAQLNFVPSANYLQAGIMLYTADDGSCKFIRLYQDGNNNIQFANLSGSLLSPASTVIADPVGADTMWLRIIKNGNNVGAYYSEDGETFTYLTKGTLNAAVEKILLFGSSWDSGNATAYFEDFSIDYDNHTIWTPPPATVVSFGGKQWSIAFADDSKYSVASDGSAFSILSIPDHWGSYLSNSI
jgi:regulation of enolase protein 1 (concanavalin A-like superfamily)